MRFNTYTSKIWLQTIYTYSKAIIFVLLEFKS